MNTYCNGNYTVTILDDGTKIRETDDLYFEASIPESMDIKITNFCDMGHICGYCHEASHLKGKHADLEKALTWMQGLPAGVELAIGGGNPLSHPNLIPFLSGLKELGLIANLTVNHLHLQEYEKMIRYIILDDLVKGLGISYRRGCDTSYLKYFADSYDNTVIHLIAGVDDIDDAQELMLSLKTKKCILLGYKDFRKGKAFHDEAVDKKIAKWYNKLPIFIDKITKAGGIVSFDNLGIEQMNVKRILGENEWRQFYQGDDGSHTFYIDAVKEEYALSSTSPKRYKIGDEIVQEMFAAL